MYIIHEKLVCHFYLSFPFNISVYVETVGIDRVGFILYLDTYTSEASSKFI